MLITGATGFVGRALVPALAADGYCVTAVARRTPDPGRFNTGSEICWVGLGELNGDLDWREVVSGQEVTIHLAAEAHERAAGRSLESLRDVNVAATCELARQARSAGVRHFIYLSSIGVLGPFSVEPLNEAAPLAPAEPYAQSKAEAESMLWALADGVMPMTVIRSPLIYGPSAPGNFGRLLTWARSGMALPLGAVTENQRSLLSRQNLVDFIRHVLTTSCSHNQTFHVCDEGITSTANLLKTLAQASGRQPWLIDVPPSFLRRAAWLVRREKLIDQLLGSLVVDAQKARQTLGWQPRWTLQEGLRRAVMAHRSSVK